MIVLDTRGKRIRTAGREGVTDMTFRLTCGSLYTTKVACHVVEAHPNIEELDEINW